MDFRMPTWLKWIELTVLFAAATYSLAITGSITTLFGWWTVAGIGIMEANKDIPAWRRRKILREQGEPL